MASIFSKIIAREVPGHFLYEDDVCIVLLDIAPTIEGQCVVVPKQEVDYIFDLDNETYSHLWKVAQKIAKALDATFGTLRTCIVVEGTHVPHVHIKLYPLTNFDKPFTDYMVLGSPAEDEVLTATAEKIKAHLD